MSLGSNVKILKIKQPSNIGNSNTLYVGGSGPNNYTKIQDAVDNASDEDTVFVYCGIYNENVSINKSINLIGEDKEKAIIDEGGWFYGKEDVINISADGVTISGFSLTGCAGYKDKAGIKIQSSYNMIYNNYLYDNERGIYLLNSSSNNTICNNYISNSAYSGIYLYHSSNNTLYGNTIIITGPGISLLQSSHNLIYENNIMSVFVGIYLVKSSSVNTIFNNHIANTIWEGILLWRNCNNNTIKDNTIERGGDRGIFIQESYNNDILNNTLSYNDFTGVNIVLASHNNISHNLIIHNKNGIGIGVNSNNNIVSFNTIVNNKLHALYLGNVSNNIINKNILANSEIGIFLWQSYNNIVLRNNIMNNLENAKVEESTTTLWDDGKYGNFWDDYTGEDNDGDGIGDTPYTIAQFNQDNYPLMEPYGEFNPDAPNAPSITGPTGGKVGTEYDYSFVTTDPNDDKVYYYITWGDGTFEEWIGPYDSGEMITVSHIWTEWGQYKIVVRAKDTNDLIGLWGTLSMTISKSRAISINSLFYNLLEQFPILQKILGYIL
jgi:parallel beta-helix repeat protein